MLLIFGLRSVNLCLVVLLSASSDISEGRGSGPVPIPSVSAFDGTPAGTLHHTPLARTPEHPLQLKQPSPPLFAGTVSSVSSPAPTTPTITTIPTAPTISTNPTAPTIPTAPKIPKIPTNPTAPTAPTVPTAPTISTTPTNSSASTVPKIPSAPTVPTAPKIPSAPTDSTTPKIPTAPTAPTPTTALGTVGAEISSATSGSPTLEPTHELARASEPQDARVTSRSYLLLLAGNATVVRLREKDFAKYLKLNLAARLSLEYDDVQVNQVLVAPSRLVVNVSVVSPRATAMATGPGRKTRDGPRGEGPHGDSPLHKMADSNATLLELSGEEYRIVRLVSLHADPPVGGDLHIQHHLQDEATYSEGTLAPRSVASRHHHDALYIVPVLVGALCLAVLFAISLRHSTKRHYNRFWVLPKMLPKMFPKMLPKMLPKTNRRVHRILEAEDHLLPAYLAPPAVIYSGPFADHAATSRLHWLQLEETSSKLLGANLPVDVTTPKHSQLHSPSKLHIFSCRPGAVVIPLRYNHAQQPCRGNGFPLG